MSAENVVDKISTEMNDSKKDQVKDQIKDSIPNFNINPNAGSNAGSNPSKVYTEAQVNAIVEQVQLTHRTSMKEFFDRYDAQVLLIADLKLLVKDLQSKLDSKSSIKK